MRFLIVHGLLWLDNLTQESLRRVVPHVDDMLVDPADYFKHQEVTIPPWRRFVRGTFLGLSLLFMPMIVIYLLAINFDIIAVDGPRRQPVAALPDWLRFVLLVIVPIAFSALGTYLTRGATCILSASGVRLVRGAKEVFCPWSLFAAPGQPAVQAADGRNRIELPVVPAAIKLVEVRKHDVVLSHGFDVKTNLLSFRSAHVMVLENLYRVRQAELADLLLTLGRLLGKPSNVGTAAAPERAADSGYNN